MARVGGTTKSSSCKAKKTATLIDSFAVPLIAFQCCIIFALRIGRSEVLPILVPCAPSVIHYHCIQHSEENMTSAKSPVTPVLAAKPTRLTRAQRTAILKALADPKRFELLERIAKASCPLGCSDAREALDIAPATLSHHIKELQSSGLIDVCREGKFAFLSIKPGVLEALSSYLQSLSPTVCPTR
jgi:ArsR family transcriptional regulator, arsenate/arsenite/antimonite-responsive transcriptional repressor